MTCEIFINAKSSQKYHTPQTQVKKWVSTHKVLNSSFSLWLIFWKTWSILIEIFWTILSNIETGQRKLRISKFWIRSKNLSVLSVLFQFSDWFCFDFKVEFLFGTLGSGQTPPYYAIYYLEWIEIQSSVGGPILIIFLTKSTIFWLFHNLNHNFWMAQWIYKI